jgi:glycosyltransferase involved in cell wall biosynthesis
MKPLVSILIPAYNAEKTIAYTLESATRQTWKNLEIIVVNDGSQDRTAEVARGFKGVTVVTTENGGLSAAQNEAYRNCHGDYIQYLDADDLLALDKIERQLAALRPEDTPHLLLSSPWAPFFYRTRNARFVQTSLCQDLSPVEWLLRKMGENLHMQNATWLVSREVVEAAGPWDEGLRYDQDGEFFSRALLASTGVRFVPGTGIFYRSSGTSSISFIGASNTKRDALLRSMKAHIRYLRSLEDSKRVHQACIVYMQNWLDYFHPDRMDIIAELQSLAAQMGGRLEAPRVRQKYEWLVKFFGRQAALRVQSALPVAKAAILRKWDKAMFQFEGRKILN